MPSATSILLRACTLALLLLTSTSVHSSAAFSRSIQFAGIAWGVRSGYGSPGPNYWSDSPESVWVDSQGRLHLKVRKVEDTWYAAEVFSYVPARYGPHRFKVIQENPTLDALDPSLVLGLFLFKYGCGVGCESELDIEFSRWREVDSPYNVQYVAQPYTEPGNLLRFSLPSLPALTTHLIDWQPYQVTYASFLGDQYNDPANLLRTWTYRGEYIPSERERMAIIIDLWMDAGTPPGDEQEVEVIIVDAGISTVCLPVQSVVCGQTVWASSTEPMARDQIDRYPVTWWSESGPEVAYRFKPISSLPVSFQLSNTSSDLDLFVLDGSSGNCSSTNAIAAGNEVINMDALAGQEYYLLVDGAEEGGGNYDLRIDCSGQPPPPDLEKPFFENYFPFVQNRD